jgi:phage-related protein
VIGQTVIFDGHRINDLFRVGVIEVGLPSFEPTAVDARRGSLVRGVRMGTSQIVVPLVAKRVRGHPTRESVSTLVSWLDVDGARFLELSGDDGLRRLVVPSGQPTVDEPEWGDVLTLAFEQVDPYLYGETKSMAWSSLNYTARLAVGGDAPTRPTIEGTLSTSAASGLWLARLDNATSLGVTIGRYDGHAVRIDCDARTVTLDGAHTTITLDSDWLELAPGAHTLAVVTGGIDDTALVTWTERWHA